MSKLGLLQSSVGVVSHAAVLVLSRSAILQQGKALRDETKTGLKGTTIGVISAYLAVRLVTAVTL